MAITNTYNFQFNAWDFGGVGNPVQVLSVDGLEDLPSLRTQDENRGYLDGMWTGRDFLNGRTITISLQIMSDANGSMFDYLAAAKTYLKSQQTGTSSLRFRLPGRPLQQVQARVRRRSIRIDPEYTYGKATMTVEFFAPDPRIYDYQSQTATVTANLGFGRNYDRAYSMTYSVSAGVPIFMALQNTGNYETGISFSVSGACVAPLIQCLETADFLSFPSLTMTSVSPPLQIETESRQVAIGGSSARNLLTNSSSWFNLPANSTRTITLSAASGNPTLTATWYNASI